MKNSLMYRQFLSLLLLISIQLNSQKIYQINAPVGFFIKAKVVMDMEMFVNEKTKPVTTHTVSYYRLIATKISDDYTEFDLIVDSMIVKAEKKGEMQTINSNKPKSYEKEPKMKETFEMIGKPMPIKIAKNGKLIKDGATSQLAEYCVLQFSDGPISVQETWETIQEVDNYGVKLTTKTKNTLESIENGLMKIKSISQNDMLGPEPVSAYMYCDEKTGLLKNYECSVTMKLFGTMKMNIAYQANW